MQFGLLYTGSDDGLIHVSKDGGTTETKFLKIYLKVCGFQSSGFGS
jgi:hypothetical protein